MGVAKWNFNVVCMDLMGWLASMGRLNGVMSTHVSEQEGNSF
jgi:hypothetical protein